MTRSTSIRAALSGLGLAALMAGSLPAQAQTLNYMKALDAPHFDSHRTTWSPTGDVVHLVQDTLVALDWDGKTPIPLLAKSWTISPDGRTYTFKLRDDVTFCSGKKFTAEDVVYSFKRQVAVKGPYTWRGGKLKDVKAIDPYTVHYEMHEGYSDLLVQLTMSTSRFTTRTASRAWARTTAPRVWMAPGPGALCPGSRAPRRF